MLGCLSFCWGEGRLYVRGPADSFGSLWVAEPPRTGKSHGGPPPLAHGPMGGPGQIEKLI
jgi:hypothetical protein